VAVTGSTENARVAHKLGYGGFSVIIECPDFLGLLLRETLSGWRNESMPAAATSGDITVDYDGARFFIACPAISFSRDYSDVIDALNTVFLCLAYLGLRHWPDKILLHCAAYRNESTRIAFGAKKTGKSTLITQAAMRGETVLADDLLFWNQAQNRFEALGLPLRLRRPIDPALVAAGIGEKLFIGRSLAYSKRGAFAIAPAGTTFFPDDILEAKEFGEFKPIPLSDVLASIQKHRIAPRSPADNAPKTSSIV
jgi:hypothetical protein